LKVGLTHPSPKCIDKYVLVEELKINMVTDYEVLEHLLAITMQQVLPSPSFCCIHLLTYA
jgi:hypothetical protein